MAAGGGTPANGLPDAGLFYLQIVESRRGRATVRQQVIATLGRVEDLRENGQLERPLRSGARFAEKAIDVASLTAGSVAACSARRIGPARVKQFVATPEPEPKGAAESGVRMTPPGQVDLNACGRMPRRRRKPRRRPQA